MDGNRIPLSHDVALLIDNKQKKVYFWAGPKADETQCDRGTQMASEMMQNINYTS